MWRKLDSLPPMSRGSLWSTRMDGRAIDVTCRTGSLWLTREGDSDDVLLREGETWEGQGSGTVVVEALDDRARLSVRRVEEDEVPADRRLLVVLSLFALYVIWGSTYYAMKVALETLPPF